MIPGEGELAALEFRKHYRLPVILLMDPNGAFNRRYNLDGWPLLILAGPTGKILYSENNLITRDETKFLSLVDKAVYRSSAARTVVRSGIPYPAATLARSGETREPKPNDWFPSIACDKAGRVYVVFTRARQDQDDVFLRVWDGTRWSDDQPLCATPADEFEPVLCSGSDGQVWAAWVCGGEGKKYDIMAARIEFPGKLVEPAAVTESDDDAMHPRLVCDADANPWVAYYKWHKMGDLSRDREIYLRKFESEKWSPEIHVSPEDVPDYEDHTDPTLAATPNGVLVAWSWDFHRPKKYPSEGENPSIAIRAVDRGMKMDRTRIVSGRNIDVTPAVAVDAQNRYWCLWDSFRPESRSVWMVQGNSKTGEKSAQMTMVLQERDNVCTPCALKNPKGGVTFLWSEKASDDKWILRRADTKPGGEKIATPRDLISNDNPRFPTAAFDAGGTLWVAYGAQTADGWVVKVKKFEGASKPD